MHPLQSNGGSSHSLQNEHVSLGCSDSENQHEEASLLLIVNADDFGIDPWADDSILLCFEEGVVSSSTMIMTSVRPSENLVYETAQDEQKRCPTYKRLMAAAAKAKKSGLPLGLHINLTEGYPVSNHPFELLTFYDNITDEDAIQKTRKPKLRGKFGFRTAVDEAALDDDKMVLLTSEIEIEIRAQYERFVAITQQRPTHADGHQHCNVVHPMIAECIASVLVSLGVDALRVPKDNEAITNSEDNDINCSAREQARRMFHGEVARQAAGVDRVYADKGLRTTDIFLGLNLMGGARGLAGLIDSIDTTLTSFKKKNHPSEGVLPKVVSCEVMVHSGYIDLALALKDGDGFSPTKDDDDFYKALRDGTVGDLVNSTFAFCVTNERKKERDVLRQKPTLASKGYRLGSYRDLVR